MFKLSWLLVIAIASGRGDEIVTSPDKTKRIDCGSLNDDVSGLNATRTAKLFRRGKLAWSFKALGRGIEFSWSPNSRYLLFGVTLESRDMDLYYVDTDEKHPREHDLRIGFIESQVDRVLPKLRTEFASRNRIDFDQVNWRTPNRCKFRYVRRQYYEAGDAILSIDFKARPVGLIIDKIIPLEEGG